MLEIFVVHRFFKSADARALGSNLVAMLSLRGLDFIIPLASIPYIVAKVGIANFGRLAFAQSFALYFGVVVAYGFNIAATRDIARVRTCPSRISEIYSNTLSASTLISIFAGTAGLVIIFLIDSLRASAGILSFYLLNAIALSLCPIWLFQGLERMRTAAIVVTCSKLGYLLSIFAFVREADDYRIVPMLLAAWTIIALGALVSIARWGFGVRLAKPNIGGACAQLRAGRDAFIVQFAPNLYNNSAVFILAMNASPSIVGAFSVACTLVDAILALGRVVSGVFLPYLSRDISKQPHFMGGMAVAGIAAAVTLVAFRNDVLGLLFPDIVGTAAAYLAWLSLSIPFVYVTLTIGNNWMMLQGYQGISRNITLSASLLFFIVAISTIPTWGVWGAVTTLVGGRGVIMFATLGAYVLLKRRMAK